MTKIKKILIVDDEPSIVTLLQYHFEKEGYQVVVAYDGETALALATEQSFYFIVLDVMLPKLDGIEVLRELRMQQNPTPILLLTAKDDLIDKLLGLEIGADDYMTKPFSPRELLARMKTIMRRIESSSQTRLTTSEEKQVVGQLTIYPTQFLVEKNNQVIQLTRKEFELLAYFMHRVGRIIDRETLLKQLWKEDWYDQSRTVDIHISHLREKIEDTPKKPIYLKTVRGFGYQFQDPMK